MSVEVGRWTERGHGRHWRRIVAIAREAAARRAAWGDHTCRRFTITTTEGTPR